MHLLNRNNSFCLKDKMLCSFSLFLFLWMAIIGSRCHLAGEDSPSSWNSLIKAFSPKFLSGETVSCLSYFFFCFLILPWPSPNPILSFSMTLHVSICSWLMVQVKIKKMASLNKKKWESYPFQCLGMHACYTFYVGLSLPNESVSTAMSLLE